ncbi:hypothetical protein JI721_06845 [Alicyclobacillus cycloheptanicus]|uniref:Uncharacterized protein n=1 Tax=Alicyclobacillus cycloheptanicus TaxID=1457 RepID=A0ABT9XJ64_9BACL|nr:hypothetical protein [Alicyclobacillus cycloheptanicus]MDQ0189828.1 hypothetical protein [Alicyclobacillus cycloheptanicus]WDM02486.1 hypothetical protein JI721_06845 [Alicyclobacillus cycloheptanicus]
MSRTLRIVSVCGVMAAVTLCAAPVFAGTAWIPFSKQLPRLGGVIQLSQDTNQNNTNAQADISNVGSNYLVNLDIQMGNTQESNIYYGAGDNTLASFVVDASTLGKQIELYGWNDTWTAVRVEVDGHFRADS